MSPRPQKSVDLRGTILSFFAAKRPRYIAWGGLAGSAGKGKQYGDVDLVAVFRDPPPIQRSNRSCLVRFVSDLRRFLIGSHPVVGFPTHRLSTFIEYIRRHAHRAPTTMIHFLVYPSFAHLHAWEPRSLASRLLRDTPPWSGSRLGGQEKPQWASKQTFQLCGIEENVHHLLSLLYQSYLLLHFADLPHALVTAEISHKAAHIHKYLILEAEEFVQNTVAKKLGKRSHLVQHLRKRLTLMRPWHRPRTASRMSLEEQLLKLLDIYDVLIYRLSTFQRER